jgi:hypothetical protein
MNNDTDNYTQVCVWPGTVVGDTRDEFVKFMMEKFNTRVIYLEEIKTNADRNGPGGRNDLFFAVHHDDIPHFCITRLDYGIRWIDDVYNEYNKSGHLYPDRVQKYRSW